MPGGSGRVSGVRSAVNSRGRLITWSVMSALLGWSRDSKTQAPTPRRVFPAWVGRRYAHVALPGAFPTSATIDLLDRAIAAEGGWHPVADHQSAGVLLSRVWRHERSGAELLLMVLGYYPVVMSICRSEQSGHGGLLTRIRGSGSARRALRRVQDAVTQAGGWAVRDADLASSLSQSLEGWRRVIHTERCIGEESRHLTHRSCSRCGAWSRYAASRCRACDHPFAVQDDMTRDARKKIAYQKIRQYRTEITALGQGKAALEAGVR